MIKCPSCNKKFEPNAEQIASGFAACDTCFSVLDLKDGKMVERSISSEAQMAMADLHQQLHELRQLSLITNQHATDVSEGVQLLEGELHDIEEKQEAVLHPKRERGSLLGPLLFVLSVGALTALAILPSLKTVAPPEGFVSSRTLNILPYQRQQVEPSTNLLLTHRHDRFLTPNPEQDFLNDEYIVLTGILQNTNLAGMQIDLQRTLESMRLEDHDGRFFPMAAARHPKLGAVLEGKRPEILQPRAQLEINLSFKKSARPTHPLSLYFQPVFITSEGDRAVLHPQVAYFQ